MKKEEQENKIMIREFKFRGKEKTIGWVYGSLLDFGDEYAIHLRNSEGSLIVDPETVGQYTGLKDKNGVEIFEGDIVDWVDSDYYIRRDVVRWINGGLVLCNSSYTVGSYPQNKVIGNIHDNPELLKKIGSK